MRKIAARAGSAQSTIKLQTKSRGGRPTREEEGLLTERLIEVGTALFFAHGFEVTSIERIAGEAGVSKRTFYSRFPTKAKLFEAVVERFLMEGMIEIEAGTPPAADATAEQWLAAVGLNFLEFNLRPRTIEFVSVILSVNKIFPEISVRVNEICNIRVKIFVQSALEQFHERGEIELKDAHFAATMFLHLCIGYFREEATMGRIKPQVDTDTRNAFLKSVDFFLHGCRAK